MKAFSMPYYSPSFSASHLSTSSRTIGATSFPNNSIAFITSSCGIEPSGTCSMKRVTPTFFRRWMIFSATVFASPTYRAPSKLRAASKLERSYLPHPRSLPRAFITCCVDGKNVSAAISVVSAMKPCECVPIVSFDTSWPACFAAFLYSCTIGANCSGLPPIVWGARHC